MVVGVDLFYSEMPSIATVRAHAAAATENAGIRIDNDAILRVVERISKDQYEKTHLQHGMAVPLRFSSPEEHLNFVCVMAMLNACSGYRSAFHESTGKGAADNMRRLALGLFLTPHVGADGPPPLSAAGLKALGPGQFAEILGVSLHTEAPHPTLPGVIVGTVGGPLHEALDALASMCRETGEFLVSRGYGNLGSYVNDAITAASASDDAIGTLLSALAHVPGFADAAAVDGQEVYIFKKALLLIHTLISSAERIQLPALSELAHKSCDASLLSSLPLFVDNVIPTLLIHWGVIQGVPQSALSNSREISTNDGYRIRAAALTAGAQIVQRARGLAAAHTEWSFLASATESELDAYIWSVAKEPELRSIRRIAEKSVMY